MAFCNPCLRPADSSILTHSKHSSTSLRNLFRRRSSKKCPPTLQRPIQKQESNRRFQRVKGASFIREVNTPSEPNQTIELLSNYDMTVFHDDELDDTQVALTHRQSKKIPRWARKSQLQLAIINQIYYNDKQPEDIFGAVHLDDAQEMVNSIELWNTEVPLLFSYANLPPNFV